MIGNRQHPQHMSPYKRLCWWICLAGLIIISIYPPASLTHFSAQLTYPLLIISNKLTKPIKKLFQSLKRIKYLNSKSTNLKAENARLVDENVKLRATLDYMHRSADAAEFIKRYNKKGFKLAQILSTNISKTEHSCFIDKGIKDGITVGSIAIRHMQILGKIEKVYPNYSTMRLITDKLCKIAAKIHNNIQTGICEGQNIPNLCKMLYLPNPQKLQLGSLVFSSGKGLIVPEGFVLGEVVQIAPPSKGNPAGWEVTLKPTMQINEQAFCHVISSESLSAG